MSSSLSNIVHVTSWLSRQGGGIPPVVWSLARQTTRSGIGCSVAGLSDQWISEDCSTAQVSFATGKIKGPAVFGFSSELSDQVRAMVKPGSVVHSHGLWMYPGVVARKCARRVGCPLVISPHGMLEPWALNNSRWKKQLAGQLFENHNLRVADCLHALCAAEADNFRRYGLRNPIAIIPNGINISEIGNKKTESSKLLKTEILDPGQKALLFLSRLHPKKGLENLLRAWAKIQQAESTKQKAEGWVLVIAGAGEPAYEQELKGLVQEYGLNRSVRLCGPVYGEEKKQLLAAADGFVLPSFSEGFSMAVLEAAAAGLPVVLTPECNFPELAAAGAALEVSPNAAAIEIGLRRLLALSVEERKHMGKQGRALVRESYTWPAVAGQMLAVYRWLLGSGPKPACVTCTAKAK